MYFVRIPAKVMFSGALGLLGLCTFLSSTASAVMQFSLPTVSLREGVTGQTLFVHCEHDVPITAYSVSIRCDPLKVRVSDVSTAGTSAANPDFFHGRNVDGDLTYGVVLGISQTSFKVLAPSPDHTLLRLTVDVLVPAPANIPLAFVDGLDGGNAPISNVITDSAGHSVHPDLVNGSITVFGGEFELLMTVPRLDGLTAVLPAPGGDVNVDLDLRYDARGKLICGGACTIDGSAVSIKGTIRSRLGAWLYQLSIKGTQDKVRLQVTGEVKSGKANARYAGPKRKAALRDAPVTLFDKAENLSGDITLSPQVDAKGKVTGTGTIVSGFGNDSGSPGILKGRLKGDKLSLTLSSGVQKLAFKGVRSEDIFTGTLKVNLPPEKGVRSNASVPAIFKLPSP